MNKQTNELASQLLTALDNPVIGLMRMSHRIECGNSSGRPTRHVALRRAEISIHFSAIQYRIAQFICHDLQKITIIIIKRR